MTRKIKCPYCKQPAKLVSGDELFTHRKGLSDKLFWRCDPCDAHVGCHNKKMKAGKWVLDEPMGSLANKQLRDIRTVAHGYFDAIWKSGQMERKQAYAWLAKELNIDGSACHIGMFNVERCHQTVAACRKRQQLNRAVS